MKCHYNFYLIIFYFCFDLIQAFVFNFTDIKEKIIIINDTGIFLNNSPFQKKINNTFFNCTYLEIISTTTTFETFQENLLCLKNKTLYILSPTEKKYY